MNNICVYGIQSAPRTATSFGLFLVVMGLAVRTYIDLYSIIM